MTEYETDEERDAIYGSHIEPTARRRGAQGARGLPMNPTFDRPFADLTDDQLREYACDYGREIHSATHVARRAAAQADLAAVLAEQALRAGAQRMPSDLDVKALRDDVRTAEQGPMRTRAQRRLLLIIPALLDEVERLRWLLANQEDESDWDYDTPIDMDDGEGVAR